MSHWNVTYPKDQYSSGTYEVQVEIYRWTLFYWNIGSKRLYFELTREYRVRKTKRPQAELWWWWGGMGRKAYRRLPIIYFSNIFLVIYFSTPVSLESGRSFSSSRLVLSLFLL